MDWSMLYNHQSTLFVHPELIFKSKILISALLMSELPPLNTDTIWGILNDQIDDATVLQLVWYYLGYRYDSTTGKWDNSTVAPEWRDEYPEPPNFLESRPATMKLTRSIPQPYKQGLKEKLGFKGYKIGTFTPRDTRRATSANWLLSYLLQTTDNQ